MENLFRKLSLGVGLAALLSSAVLAAPVTVNDQIPAPVPSASNTANGQSEVLLQSYAISGGTLYQSCFRGLGPNGLVDCSGLAFVGTGASGSLTRNLDLSNARLDSGIIPTIASGQSGTGFAIVRTAGTNYALVGVATSSSAVTTKAMWETNVAQTYVSGAVLPIVVNANYVTTGTVTAASTTLTVTAYTEVGGVETAITGITAAQQFTATPTGYTFNIPTTAGLAVGQHIVVEVAMLVTTSAGAATGQINAVGLVN